ncbi:tail fiber protein [Burkholderia phage vB_BceS_AH2]|uniref:Tail fiber protein n=1 Tax=Burkholderia phage vB_BceS_AH2 TaxID=1133022 RepID=I6NSG7_9CAUD|nr:tail fiber protein [Burkholderia phage vB_BceS_AH2]AEY69562.1 tail fiber protein [Burkholderia phage vB_BceS_AH2]
MDANMKLIDALLGGGTVISNTTTASGASVTWDAAKTTAGVTLSNGNLTAATPGPTLKGTVANTGLVGKTYHEVTLVSGGLSANASIGIGPQAVDLTKTIGWNGSPDSAGLQIGGTKIWYNAGQGNIGMPGAVVGSVIGIAFDAATRKVWFRVNNGNWNNAASGQDPATGAGGYVITGTQALYPALTSDVANTFTANFGGSTFAYAAPAGFVSPTAAVGGAQPGDAYIIPANATGTWAGKTNQIAIWIDNVWAYIVPKRGLRVEVQSAGGFMWFNGTAWVAEATTGLGTMATQNADAAAITGGTIDGTTIGLTSRALKVNSVTGDFSYTDPSSAPTMYLTRNLNRTAAASDIPSALQFAFSDSSTANRLSAQVFRLSYTRTSGATGIPTAFDSLLTIATPLIQENAGLALRAMAVEGPTVAAGKNLDTFEGLRIGASGGAGTVTNKTAIIVEANAGAVVVGAANNDKEALFEVFGNAKVTGPLKHGQYTLATMPSASAYSGYLIDVTDAAGGPKTCRSDGTNWKILNTTTTVS